MTEDPSRSKLEEPASSGSRRSWSPAWTLALLILLTALLQASRLPMRWNQISFAYAAYFGEYLWWIEQQGPWAALTSYVGIHPPGYSLLFATMAGLGASPFAWHALSGLFSVAALPTLMAVARSGIPAQRLDGPVLAGLGLLVASSPHRIAYGLEINNYPLLVLMSCLQMLTFARMMDSPRSLRSRGLLAMSTAGLLWTHALGLALPAAQFVTLLVLPEGRQNLRSLLQSLLIAALLCLPLLPGLLEILSGDSINPALGPKAAWTSMTELLPGRYGSLTAAWAVLSLAGLGATASLKLPPGERLVPLSWLLHCCLATGLIATMISMGIASATQLPYWLAPLPSLLLLAGCAAALSPEPRWQPSQGLLFRAVTPRRAMIGVMVLCAAVNSSSMLSDFSHARTVRSQAASNYPLIAAATRAWGPQSSLALIQFPQYLDDDKDAIDPIYPLLPLFERLWFDDPQVDGMVPFDPFFGQPVRYGDGRWLYTFTSVSLPHLAALHDHLKSQGRQLIIAAYGCSFSERETNALNRWAQQQGAKAQLSEDSGLWLWNGQQAVPAGATEGP